MLGEPPSLIQQHKGHKESITALDLHPKCRYAASAGQDFSFYLWDLKEQSAPRKYEGHKVTNNYTSGISSRYKI